MAGSPGAGRGRVPCGPALSGVRCVAGVAGGLGLARGAHRRGGRVPRAEGRRGGPGKRGGRMTAGPRPRVPRSLGPTDVKRLNRSWRQLTQARVGLLLDSVSQPFNVGSIVRTAAAFGVERIWLCGDTAPPEHPQARKTALGTGRFVTFEREPGAGPAASAAASAGLKVIPIELAQAAIPLHEAPLGGDVCLPLGHEDRPCASALRAAPDVIAYLPHMGGVGTLTLADASC